VLTISAPALTFTIALTLCTEVIAQHRTKDEVLLGSQFVERTSDNEANRIETFLKWLKNYLFKSWCKGTTKIPMPQYSKMSVLSSEYVVFLLKDNYQEIGSWEDELSVSSIICVRGGNERKIC